MSIIHASDAQNLLAKSRVRRAQISATVNGEIQRQARKGLNTANYPPALNDEEVEWLTGELILQGFKANADRKTIGW